METRAAVAWEAGKPLTIETIRLEGPKAGEVLVEVMATGVCHTDAYTLSGLDSEGKFPANVRFVNDFKKKYGYMPSHFASQAYDAPFLLDSAVKAVKGDLNNKMGMIKAMEKANFDSVRGPFTYNVNHMPIQNYYKREVVRGADGKPTIRTTGIVLADHKDSYYKDCKMKW